MSWDDFFGFKRMITPVLIRIVFILAVVGIVLGGIIGMCGSIYRGIVTQRYGMALASLLLYPIGTVLGLFLARVYAELLIVVFRIYETLNEIEEALRLRQAENAATEGPNLGF